MSDDVTIFVMTSQFGNVSTFIEDDEVVVEIGDPVSQVEDEKDWWRDVEGANVDVVAQLDRGCGARRLQWRQLHRLLPLLLRQVHRVLVERLLLFRLLIFLRFAFSSKPPKVVIFEFFRFCLNYVSFN